MVYIICAIVIFLPLNNHQKGCGTERLKLKIDNHGNTCANKSLYVQAQPSFTFRVEVSFKLHRQLINIIASHPWCVNPYRYELEAITLVPLIELRPVAITFWLSVDTLTHEEDVGILKS